MATLPSGPRYYIPPGWDGKSCRFCEKPLTDCDYLGTCPQHHKMADLESAILRSPEYIRMEHEALQQIVRYHNLIADLASVTDQQLALMVEEQLLSNAQACSDEDAFLTSAIARLKRSTGGPLKRCH